MPFDSNGVFSRVMNWTSDQQNGIAIECGRHDAEDDNFAQGFNDCFCRDGRAAATGDFNLGNYKVKNVAAGTATTDAVNKGQLDSGLSAKANTSDVVNLTGMQTITGYKTFAGTGWITRIQNTNVTYNTAPSSNTATSLVFTDKNGKEMGIVECWRNTNNSTIMQLNTYGASGTWASNSIGLGVEANGYTWTYAPPSDSYDSIVTTRGIGKWDNGYVRLGNGITLQWGRYDNGVNSAGFKGTITLPTPFASTAYSFSLVGTRGNDEDITAAVNCEGRWKSTTAIGFQCSRTSGSSAGIRYIDWVAIGY